MEQRSGVSALAYTGVQARTPPEWVTNNRAPLTSDYRDYFVGTFWLHMPDKDLYFLATKTNNTGIWILLTAGTAGIQTITGNAGGAVGPDVLSNVNIVGAAPYVVTGNPGAWTLTISDDGTTAVSYLTDDANSAIPAVGVLKVYGTGGIVTSSLGNVVTVDGSGVVGVVTTYEADDASTAVPIADILKIYGDGVITGTTAATNIMTIGAATSVATNGQTLIGRTGNTPIWNSLTSTGGTVTITPGVGTVNLEVTGGGAVVYGGDNINIAPASTVNLNESIHWPFTNAAGTAGVIYLNAVAAVGGDRFLHAYGPSFGTSSANVFLGLDAGNFTNTSTYNVGVGASSLTAVTSGSYNTACGAQALQSVTTATGNVAIGSYALRDSIIGSYNTAVGYNALIECTGDYNTAIGYNACVGALTGSSNATMGAYSGSSITSGTYNLCLGSYAGQNLTTSDYTVCVGYDAGSNYTVESSNIVVSNAGVVADANTIRLGTHGTGNGLQNRCFIAGIRGITTGVADGIAVLIDSSYQLGTVSSSRRYKQNVFSMGDDSSPLYDLSPVVFEYKTHPGIMQYGLIAEEVAPIMPRLVVRDSDGLPETIKYHELPVLLLNELKKLKLRVDALEALSEES